jgi:lysophospholipid acyltransferase 5
LIGLAFDYYDGGKSETELKGEFCKFQLTSRTDAPDQQENRLKRLPSVLEIYGYCYFYSAFLVGPQVCYFATT